MGSRLERLYEAFWSTPDPLLIAAGVRGEQLVARIRLALAAVLLLIPASNVLLQSDLRESLVGLSATVGVFLISLAAYILTERDYHRPWFGLVTSCFDVTLVSAALSIFLLFGEPHTAVNSKVVFEGYFLAIGATTLRYDKRICVVATLLALVEYFDVVVIASTWWDLNNPIYAPFSYGMFSWTAQTSRLILMLTAGLLSLAVVSRTQQLLRLSTSDPLTTLFNRGYFGERIAVEVSRASRYKQALTIAMVDVDHFKSFNDQHGHVAGDTVLQMIASTLRCSFRKSDIVARYGGEEFVIVMPETDSKTASRKLEEFRRTVENTPLQVSKAHSPVYITISAGVAGLPNDGMKDEDIINIADARLFQAKRNGRNRIVDA
jgi:diguanylate cyclase (GGDEF)-like protein